MKRNILSFIFGLVVAMSFAFQANYTVKKSTAEVDQEGGIYIFLKADPVMEYEYLGKLNMPEVVSSKKTQNLLATAIKRCKKQYPDANGIIVREGNLAKIDAVKL